MVRVSYWHMDQAIRYFDARMEYGKMLARGVRAELGVRHGVDRYRARFGGPSLG